MNNKQKTMKRVMAVMLVLSMMLSTLDGYATGLFTAFAEDAMEQAEAAPQENAASEEEIQKQEEAPKPEDALKQEEAPAAGEAAVEEESQQEEAAAEESAIEGEPQQEETSAAGETAAEEEAQQEEAAAEGSAVAGEAQQEEPPAAGEAAVEEESQQEEAAAEESAIAGEPQQEETSAAGETAAEEEAQQEEATAAEVPTVEEEAQQEETSDAEETVAEEETQQEEKDAEQQKEPKQDGESEEEPAPVGETTEEVSPAGKADQPEAGTDEAFDDGQSASEVTEANAQGTIDEAVDKTETLNEEMQSAEEPAPAGKTEPAEEPAPVEPGIPLDVNPEPVTGPAIPVITYPEANTEANTKEETVSEEKPVGLIVLLENEEMDFEQTDRETEAAVPEALGPRTLNVRAGQYTITAEGNLPEGAELRAVEIPADVAEKMVGKKALFAYDVQILVDGKIWQPEEHGEEVRIFIQDENGAFNSDDISVLHVKTNLVNDDGSLSEETLAETIAALDKDSVDSESFSTSAKEGVVAFTTKSLSPLVGSEKALLQSMIDDAMNAVSGALKGLVTVVLNKNTTYEGDITITAGDRAVADDFKLELVADDAGDSGRDGSGTTLIDGKVTIKGFYVILKSVLVSDKKSIIVSDRSDSTNEEYKKQGGTLEFIGTKNAPNEINVVVETGSSAIVSTTDDDDIISVEAKPGAKSVTVDTGEGVDTVNATLYGGAADLSTGFGADKLNISIAGGINQLRVDAGDSADTLAIVNNGSADAFEWVEYEAKDEVTQKTSTKKKQAGGIIIKAGAGDDVISVDVRDKAGSMILDTGDGGDEVEVIKGDHFTLMNKDYDQYTGANESPTLATTAVLTIENADRSDRITIDASAALAIKGIEMIGGKSTMIRNAARQKIANNDKTDEANPADLTAISANDPGASVYLKGILAAPTDLPDTDPITWIDANDSSKGFRLHTTLDAETTKNDYTLDITGSPSNNFTDTLKNKRRVELYNAETGNAAYTKANAPFTDYILKNPVDSLSSITVTGSDSALLLSNLVLDADEIRNSGGVVTLKDVTANNLNVLVKGQEINLNGTIKARNVRAESAQGTESNLRSALDLLKGEESFGDMAANLFSISDAAVINVRGTIEADQDIALVTRVKHNGGMITLLPAEINVLNIKVADAIISIADGAKLITQNGNVTALSKIKTTTGYRYNTDKNEEAAVQEGMPLAVTVIVDNALVNVSKAAEITAGADAVLHAQSDIMTATYANSSAILPSPLDIAVTVILNNAKTDVYGKVTAGRKVQASATGTIKDENVATGAASAGGLSGGYIAVNVVDQDVDAIIHTGAVITAGGNVRVATTGNANITTSAISGAARTDDDQVSTKKALQSLVKNLGKTVINKISEYLDRRESAGLSENEQFIKNREELKKKLEKLLSEDYQVKLIQNNAENDAKGSPAITMLDDGSVSVNANPKSGCQVEEIYYRYLEPGKSSYTYVHVPGLYESGADWNTASFQMPSADIEVFVVYRGQPDGRNNDAANRQQGSQQQDNGGVQGIGGVNNLINDAQNAAGGNAEEDEALYCYHPGENDPQYALRFAAMQNGSVVTWLSNDDRQSIRVIYAGQKLLLVPNPGTVRSATGDTQLYKLTQDSLVVTYQAQENGKTVTKRDVVTQDKQGRYVYTVPRDLAEGTILTVGAEFEPAGDGETQDSSHFQATGAVAVGVLNNDSRALIETGTTVTAGGQVDMFGFKLNRNTTTADGTAVVDNKKEEKKDKPKPILKNSYGVGGAEFSLRLNSNVDGAVTGTVDRKETQGATAYHPKFTMTAENARNVDKIVLSYYSKLEGPGGIVMGNGTRRTVTLVRREDGSGNVSYEEEGGQLGGIFPAFEVKTEDGKEIITANLTGLTILQGTTADVSFIFRDTAQAEQMADTAAGSQDYLIRNPIQISYNALRKKDKTEIQMGTVTYDGNHGNAGKYYFRVAPNTAGGYTIDDFDPNDYSKTKSNKDVLYASWTDANGKVQKAELKRAVTDGNGVWYFEPGAGKVTIPQGAVITVSAVFREDLRDVKTADDFDAEAAHGSVQIKDKQAKAGDEEQLTLTADQGYVASKVQVSWFEPGTTSWKTQEYDVDRYTGTVLFTVPRTTDAAGSYVKITPVFEKKDITILKSDNCVLSEKDSMGWQGGKITVLPNEDNARDGYKVTSVTVTYGDGTVEEINGKEVTLPIREEGGTWYDHVTIQAHLDLKIVRLQDFDGENGKVEFSGRYADASEVVTVLPKPGDGYRVKDGTLKLEINTGTGHRQIVLRKDKKGNYTFTMPNDADKNTTIRVSCEFEPGADGLDASLGASLAVGVTDSDNNVEIKGGTVSAAKGYSLIGLTVGGKAITEAKAGFNEGNFGLAGAFAVQVANADNVVAIRKDERGSISLDQGMFFMLGVGKMDFKVTGDASGKKKQNEAGSTGVGAGIAFAVDNLTVTGEIEDGVKLVRYGADKATPQITGATMIIGQKFKDEVKAKAGATGGSAWVPVAAVDISNVEATSRFGRLDISDLQAPLQPKVNAIVKAAEEAKIDAESSERYPGVTLDPVRRKEFADAMRAEGNGQILTAAERRAAIEASSLTDDEKMLAQDILPMTGKVKIKSSVASAKAEYNHVVTADASARGGKTAMGGAFIVTWINDRAESILNQSLRTNKAVSVTSSSGSALNAVATAAVSGGAGGDKDDQNKKGGADKQADKLLGGAVGMAGKYGGGNAAAMQRDADNRQLAETAESSIAGAGALVLNIQKNKSRAEIMDGVTVITKDRLEVKSANRVDATIKANASTTKSDTGVGVGVALNIVTMENIARIGTGYIEAGELELTADIARVPANIRKRTNIENASTMRSVLEKRIEEEIKSLIPEEYTKFGAVDLTKLVSTFVGTFTGKLIEDMGLEKLVSLNAGESTGEGFVNAGKIMTERLKAFPLSLVNPWRTAIEEFLEPGEGYLDGEWWATTGSDLLRTLTAEWAGDAWQTIVNGLIKENADALLGGAMDMVSGKLSGKGWDSKKLQETLKNATSKALDGFTDQLVDTFVNKMGDRLPLLNQANIQRIKDFKAMLKDKTKGQIVGELWKDTTKAFREQVWDYEKYLVTFSENGFVETAKKELWECLKNSTTAMTNELLDQIAGSLDVRFEKKPKADRHVITTQAISGAGAKEKSGAGSLAVAWANLTTTAVIADSARDVKITGDGAMIVTAEELRRIRTHATAAVDANGEADNNDEAGASEEKKSGGNSDARLFASKDQITVNFNAGGRASFDEQKTGGNTRVWLDADKGYELNADTMFKRSYTDQSGTEIVNVLKVHKEGDDYYILPYEKIDINNVAANDLKDLAVGIDIDFKRAENNVCAPKAEVTGNVPKPKEGAVTVGVEGRKVENNVLKAEYGDLVKITVDPSKVPGAKVKEITYSYLAPENGQPVQKTGKLSEGQVMKQSSNGNETVYVFSMPEAEVQEIKVIFEEGGEERASRAEATDAKGRSIGAGFAVALTHGTSETTAQIGKRDAGVTAGTLAVRAILEHEQENYTTAGTDPFQGVDMGEKDEGKETGMDASVSVFMLDNNVTARIAGGTKVTTTADAKATFTPSWAVNARAEADEASQVTRVTSGAVVVQASETGATKTKASAFATGSTTAAGASVAVNVALSDIKAEVGDAVTATGAVTVKADSSSKDDTWSFASALGADVQRGLNKFADKVVGKGQESVNKLTTGEYFDKKAKDEKDKKKANDTSRKITNRLNDDRVKAKDGDDASENLNVSTNVLRSQGAKLDGGDDANQAAREANNQANAQAVNAGGEGGAAQAEALQNGNQSKKLQVAATVGFNVAQHSATVTVNGAIDAGGNVVLSALNDGNFRTRATAAAMTTEEGKGKTIAAAVGVSVNNNEATVKADGDIEASGDVSVAAKLTQNTDEDFIGKLAVQAVSGSVSGKGSEWSVAGAAGMLSSHATSKAEFNGKTLSGDTVNVLAYDKSKLGVRAGGINVSKGANVGVGASVATIWSGNTVEAKVADGAEITADAFNLNATKAAVTWKDRVAPFKATDVFTDSSKLSDEERENVSTGLIDIHKKPGETSYKVDINMDTYALMKLLDAANVLSYTNYYAESIAGSLVTGSADDTRTNEFNGAGSFSLVRMSNTVNAALGSNVTIKKKGTSGDGVNIAADDATNARLIGGAVSGGAAQKSAGITVTFLSDGDEAAVSVGDNATIEAHAVNISAKGDTDVQAFNAAASVNTASQSKLTLGGALNILLLSNEAKNTVGSNATVTSGGRMNISASANMDLDLVSVGVGVANKAVAAGGTVAYIKDSAASTVTIGDNHALKAKDDANISARTVDKLLSVLASASVALDAEAGKAYAASINLLRSNARGNVTLGTGGAEKGVKSEKGNVSITGTTETRAVNVTVGAAGSRGRAIGLSFNGNVFDRESKVDIRGGAGYGITAAGDAMIQASGTDTTVMAALAAAGSTGGTAVGGNLPFVSGNNTVSTTIGAASITAGKEAAISSHLKDRTYAIAGSIALSNSGTAAGATALLTHKGNTIRTDLGASTVTAKGSGGALAGRVAGSPTFNGLYVGATQDYTGIVGAAGVALAGNKGITGNLVRLTSENTITADASKAKLVSYATNKVKKTYPVYYANKQANAQKYKIKDGDAGKYVGVSRYEKLYNFFVELPSGEYRQITSLDEAVYEAEEVSSGGDATVKAGNDVYQAVFAGGLNFGKSAGVGAAIIALGSGNDVKALAHDIDAYGSISVTADNTDRLVELNVNAGGSMKTAVELGVSVSSLSDNVNAVVASDVKARNGQFGLTAKNTTDITNVSVAVAGAGKTAASPVFAYTGFTGETNAILGAGTVDAQKGVSILADSKKTIDQYTIGAAFSGQTALSGAVSIASVKDKTNALAAKGTQITGDALSIEAGSDYSLVGASGALAGSGKAALAVNGLVTILKANTLAEMEGSATLKNMANVSAHSNRDIIDVAIAAAGSGGAGVGVTVMSLEAGDQMDQETADQLTYGGGDGKDKVFDAEAMVRKLKSLGVDTTSMETQKDDKGNTTRTGLADDLKGNGQKTGTDKLGTDKDGKRTFDVASGYSGDNGQTAKSEETDDVKNSKTVGESVYSEAPKDSVIARIGANAVISSKGVGVEATQETLADLFGAGIGGGGEVGGGVSIASALLRSNVIAASLGDINANGGDVNVQAVSLSGEKIIRTGTDEEARMKAVNNAMNGNRQATKRSIRVIGLAAGGGGAAGLAVAGGALRTDNITSTTLGGKITNVENVNVKSDHNYKDVLAATIGLAGGGEIGVAASVAGAIAAGTVSAKVDSTASISGAAPKVNVTTNSNVNADTVAFTAAGSGGFSMVSGVSIVRNDLTQNTSVDRGAVISSGNGKGTLTVKGKSTTRSENLLLGLSGGFVSMGLGVAVSSAKPTLNTTVGVNGTGSTTLSNLDTVEIKNDVSSTAKGGVLTASGGAAGIAANVLLVYNDTNATAKAANVAGSVGSFTIDGQLDAAGEATSIALSGGIGAVGANISYVDVNSTNTAALDARDFTIDISRKLSVIAGDSTNKRATSATTKGVTGTAGGIAVAVNTSVARNRAVNDAVITGTELNTKKVTLGAYGAGSTTAEMTGVAIGGIKVTTSVVDALNETTNRARMNLTGRLNGSLDAASDVAGTTTAKLITGGGSLVGIDTNVAIADGRTASLVDVSIGGAATGKESIKARATGKDTVTTDIDNIIGLNLGVSVVTQVGSAYTKDVYSAKVKLANGDYNLSDVSVTTDYTNTATCNVTPSSSGVNLSVASAGVNRSSAKSTAYAGAELALENASLSADKDVKVMTTGSTEVNALTRPAILSWSLAVDVGVNKAVAELKGTQAATLRLANGRIKSADAVDVQSVVNKATANAVVATSGVGEEHKGRVKLGLVSADSNTATANEQLASTASILGEPAGSAAHDANTINANSLNLYAGVADGVQTKAYVETQGAAQLGLVTVGNLDGEAYSGDVFNVAFNSVTAALSGDAAFISRTNAKSTGKGTMPGGLALVGVGISNIKSGVGTSSNMQTSKVLIGEGSRLTAANIDARAENAGRAEAQLTKGTAIALGSVAITRQPTVSWYDTAVIIGDKAELTSRGKLDALSKTAAGAQSIITSGGVGVIASADSLQGRNNVRDTNQLLIGKNVKLTSGGNMTLRTDSTVAATAKTTFDGGGGIVGATGVHATNDITRTVNLLIDDGTSVTSGGSLWIESVVGKGDDIETHAKQVVKSLLEFAKAYGTVNSRIDNTLEIGGGVDIRSGGNVEIAAYNSGVKPDNNRHGYGTRGDVNAGGGFKFDAAPDGYAQANLTFNATVNINRGGSKRSYITSENGQICVRASNDYLYVETQSDVTGGGIVGGVCAYAINQVYIDNLIRVDETTFRGSSGTHLRATFGENRGAIFNTYARAALSGVGYEKVTSRLDGRLNVAIRSADTGRVDGGNHFTHIANRATMSYKLSYSCDGWVTSKGIRNVEDWFSRAEWCDFCKHTASANKSGGKADTRAELKSSFVKALDALNDIQKMVKNVEGVSKARSGAEDTLTAGRIFVLDLEVMLEKDVTLDTDALARYKLWTNSATNLNACLLPNAARLYANAGFRLQYVTDVLRGDVRGDGMVHDIDIITALTARAFAKPVIPIGSAGSLDFSTGVFSIPENSDFELYLHEVSAAWIVDQWNEGSIRRLDADQDEINNCALNGNKLPDGRIVEGMEVDGRRRYWLGDTPETATDPDRPLVFLLVNGDTDEVDAFRTSVNMIWRGENPIDVSLYLYRDSKADQRGEEKYNCMFFDTPEGENSLVKVVTNVLMDRVMEFPKPLKIVLRGCWLDGADLPAYSIGDHFFALCDGTDGAVNMYGGVYEATFDGDIFESDYLRIEGIVDGDLRVTIKQGQPIWPEWTGADSARDIEGNRYARVDGEWFDEDEAPRLKAEAPAP